MSWAWRMASCGATQEGAALRVTGEAGMTVMLLRRELLPAGPLLGVSQAPPIHHVTSELNIPSGHHC